MRQKLVTKDGRVFHDPEPEAVSSIVFGILWSNERGGEDKAISPFTWTIVGSNPYLRDPLGEVHPIEWGNYYEAIEFASWEAFEADRTKRRLVQSEEDLEQVRAERDLLSGRLYSLVSAVYDINEKGGPNSRRKVRELLLEAGAEPCEGCGFVVCRCPREDD